MHPISAMENPAVTADSDSKDVTFEEPSYREEYYNEWENLSEPPDAGEIDHRNSDSSDFEETYIKKKAKKKEKKASVSKILITLTTGSILFPVAFLHSHHYSLKLTYGFIC